MGAAPALAVQAARRVNYEDSRFEETAMSAPVTPVHTAASVPSASPAAEQENDVVESIAHAAPIVLPIVGGVLMLLLAFIAVFMA